MLPMFLMSLIPAGQRLRHAPRRDPQHAWARLVPQQHQVVRLTLISVVGDQVHPEAGPRSIWARCKDGVAAQITFGGGGG
jgi:hypothetical protein